MKWVMVGLGMFGAVAVIADVAAAIDSAQDPVASAQDQRDSVQDPVQVDSTVPVSEPASDLNTEPIPGLSGGQGAVPGSEPSAIPGLVPEANWDFGGYVTYLATASWPDAADTGLDHLIHQRFNAEYRFTPVLRLNAGMRNRLLFGDSAELPGFARLVGADTGYMDLTYNWLEKNGVVGTSQFDRLYLTWQPTDWQLQAGRFRVNWGMATVWNPNDIFNAYSIYDVDYEERRGTDAVRISRKLGFASSVEVVYSPARDSALDSYAGRYGFNHQGWDYQLLAGKSGLDRVIGAGLAGEVVGAGVRGEFSWFEPSRDQWQGITLKATAVASAEVDYSFGGVRNWLARAALLYTSTPQPRQDAVLFLNLPLTARTLSFTELGSYAGLDFDWSALSRVGLSATYYNDGSFFLGVSNTYSLADDWQMLTVLQRFDGSTDSLFGQSAATLLYWQLRWSF
ncbi:hypothetical protein [Photobacterium sp. TY1-4]|uniref:hypothetical protein n=1 Tax=Photobacterium sp. TY1-4 TaxID=2899122 RepID=UPI0021BFF152|nr:hypothetical protein [Photobacterium sp. TY1-4]UXI00270.1 hypothetical protein NH461_10620 [Photobacterium sp. TY1-4]